MAQLNIIFENLNKFFFEGENVRIKLEVNVQKLCDVNNIMANFLGLSTYLNNDGKQNDKTLKMFRKNSSEIYFDDILPVFEAQNKEAANWSPGVQEFVFEYQLPNSLPTSIECEQGFVRYSIHVFVEINSEILKKTEYFTVVSRTDLSKDVSAHLPGVLWTPENQCLLQTLFCKNGSVRAYLHVAKRGFVPGECLYINAEICNFHRSPVEWVKASLIQILRYSNSKSSQKRIVTEIARGCILPSETQTWRSEKMLIPAIPPTTFLPKRLIHIKYKLLFQFKHSNQKKPVEMKLKIFIGAVRVLNCGKEVEQGQGESDYVYSSEFFNSSNLEPCIFGPHFIEENGISSIFSPLYPMYVVV